MSKRMLCAAVLAVFLPAGSPPAAHAAISEPTGSMCGFTALPSVNTSTLVGEMHGGPLEDPATIGIPRGAYLHCSIVFGAGTHLDEPIVSAEAFGQGVIVLPPVKVTFQPFDRFYFCTDFVPADGGPPLYWDGGGEGPLQPGRWSTYPGVPCEPEVVPLDVGPFPVDPECDDGLDNDGDSLIDWPADPECQSRADLFERF